MLEKRSMHYTAVHDGRNINFSARPYSSSGIREREREIFIVALQFPFHCMCVIRVYIQTFSFLSFLLLLLLLLLLLADRLIPSIGFECEMTERVAHVSRLDVAVFSFDQHMILAWREWAVRARSTNCRRMICNF